ncbi:MULTISPECIES: HAMP domain-containing sensor histidine kinase [unclassified Lentimicrobium]|uniref:sensor histidine kinase n=1 Tax=unclassified Lentimicrobium TaxID=2677434 RepID=UPI00155529B1|nr:MULTISPECIES: HAMP domain-containing sensor histidine kinase [unclassified Lentimicrobium]NPD47126.1 HAMP domain-containing histidine kinase [Lentimicrobium sp. S6]NPD83767.1 HAMP domain-containing histidine kinase [Lentimicrobium sp. L6]
MNKRKIQIVIIFSIFALLGSIGIQYYWINMLYEQNRVLFDQNVNRALKFAIDALDQQEKLYHIQRSHLNTRNIHRISIEHEIEENAIIFADNEFEHFQEVVISQMLDSMSNNMIIVNANVERELEFYDEKADWEFVNGNGNNIETKIHIKLKNDSIYQSFEAKADSLIQVLEYKTIALRDEKDNIETTIDQLVWEMDEWSKPFMDSIPKKLIQEVIEKSLIEYNIPNQFNFAILDSLSEETVLYSSHDFDKNSFSYFSNLYPYELIPRKQLLALQVNRKQLYLNLSTPITLSIAFTLMLTIGLLLIIKNLLHHRKISEVQSDFINNMTHEFKTPIATISLASDSILNPIILGNKDKVSYFTGMIKKENRRMNRLVEKILQMARLESKELKLEKQTIDVHEVLQNIVENTQIKLEDKGNISSDFQANTFEVLADQVHLINVFYNLLDNAIKYSEEPVQIKIATSNTKYHLSINISDKGKGMNKKELQYIFDRFYRIEAGNVHNIKGYGLGLTYVKAIIEKHGGSIHVKSELGIGSSFEIRLPIKK